eukprot:TRINITY_DN5455_c0_g1_i1.p1 TRINITY_DN5455_c0_g1~~TRINITY_DN5455_c0_g1_i1.p1  ORF type:complete len:285 (-),score=59.21 TRINITY_DN5455_c0_g1_i1:53-907(-)
MMQFLTRVLVRTNSLLEALYTTFKMRDLRVMASDPQEKLPESRRRARGFRLLPRTRTRGTRFFAYPSSMSITRDTRHKRRHTGGKRKAYRLKRKFELGRQPAATKIGEKRVHLVRVRGGNLKHRALRLDSGNFSWGSEAITRKSRILNVVYNASNNELVRTNTLVKNCIIQIDATPFKAWYEQHYGIALGKKKAQPKKVAAAPKKEGEAAAEAPAAPKTISHAQAARAKTRTLDNHIDEQFQAGRLYVCVSSRPGQSGRCDGYVLEGKELEFYLKKLAKKKSNK